MTSPLGDALRTVVRVNGGEPEATLAFDEGAVELLPYATLLTRRGPVADVLGPVVGIHEWQGAPLMVLVDGDHLRDDRQLAAIGRLVALRGDIPYVGVFAGGRLAVHAVGLGKGVGKAIPFDELDVAASAKIPYVAAVRPGTRPRAATVSKVVLKLLDDALTRLVRCGIEQADAISLAGRALFSRFLADRDLPLGEHASPEATFSTPDMALLTCRWLDATFNGNLLPLNYSLLDDLPGDAFDVLTDIMRRAPEGQLSLGWQERWDDLHFAHIPVGILSQVYEQYLKRHQPSRQKNEGSYYTPAPIADLMVRAVLRGMPEGDRHKARFLDPATGAGVFLITAFRHLVAERWRHDGVRPGTPILREILRDQVAGFDVNEGALRFAALGLYLVSIELDPDPEPVTKLAFEDLRGSVLLRPATDATMPVGKGEVSLSDLGSLGPGVPAWHDGRYDAVIGNPPWKSGVRVRGWGWVEDRVLAIAEVRRPLRPDAASGGASTESASRVPRPRSLLPNNSLDLPFVWRAAEWAKPGGQVAFALHGRLLFQQAEGMPAAREALFRGFDVTSIINGADLRQTMVWPGIETPFCIMFARNRPADHMSAMRFISPRREPRLNAVGTFRLDAAHAPLVTAEQVVGDPLTLKTLFRGSGLDLDIRRRVLAKCFPSLAEVMRASNGRSGVGVQKLRPSSRTRKGQTEPGADASYLKGLPYLRSGAPSTFVDVAALPTFADDRIHDPRSRDIFIAPLLVVDKVARPDARGFASGFCSEDLVYSENYYGYGFTEDDAGRLLAFNVAIVLRSSFARWWMLLNSGEYGFEREVVEKATFDLMPMPWTPKSSDSASEDPIAVAGHSAPSQDPHASDERRRGLEECARRFGQLGGDLDPDLVDDVVATAYGLGVDDRRVIADTLRHAFDARENAVPGRVGSGGAGRAGLGARVPPGGPPPIATDSFSDGLMSHLEPWAREFGVDLIFAALQPAEPDRWRFAFVGSVKQQPDIPGVRPLLDGFAHAADETGSTEVYHEADDGFLWIGLPDDQRHWSFSQGILCARQVIWKHMDFLMGVSTNEVGA